jgi:hypothetical protein
MQAVSDILGRLKYEVLWPAMTVIFAAGFLLFIWGLVKFLWHVEEGSSSSSSEGRQHMIWGIVGMLIMVSFWSIIALLDNTFGLGVMNGGAATDPGRNELQGVTFGS